MRTELTNKLPVGSDQLVLKWGESYSQLSANAELYVQKGYESNYLCAYEHETLAGGVLFFIKKRRFFSFLSRIVSTAPFSANNSEIVLNLLAKELKSQIQKKAPLYNLIEPSTTSIAAKFLNNAGFGAMPKATILLDLRKTQEDLFNSLDKDARWGVNKAKKLGLHISEAQTIEEWREFYDIYTKTCAKDKISPMPFNELNALKELFADKGFGQLFIVKSKDKLIAGSLIFVFRDKSLHIINASLQEFLAMQPNNLLYWHMIEFSKSKKVSYFDLGGYALNARAGTPVQGINAFKARWGGQIIKGKIFTTFPLYFKLVRIMKWFEVIR